MLSCFYYVHHQNTILVTRSNCVKSHLNNLLLYTYISWPLICNWLPPYPGPQRSHPITHVSLQRLFCHNTETSMFYGAIRHTQSEICILPCDPSVLTLFMYSDLCALHVTKMTFQIIILINIFFMPFFYACQVEPNRAQ